MRSSLIIGFLFSLMLSFVATRWVYGASPAAPKVLLDTGGGVEKRVTPSSAQVSVTGSQGLVATGLTVAVQPGPEGYPGISIKPAAGNWDLSAYGHVQAKLVNTGVKPLTVSLRVDNAGDWSDAPWDTESVTLAPGQSGILKTLFGYSYGFKPSYRLKPEMVVNVLLFTGKADQTESFRLESLTAAGPSGETPPVDPETIRTVPAQGVILGPGIAHDAAPQVMGKNAQTALAPSGVQADFPPATNEQSVSLKPAQGLWDLRSYTEVKIVLFNGGDKPFTPRVRLDSNGGPSDWTAASAPLAPGARVTLTIPFAGIQAVDLNHTNAAHQIASDAVSAVTIATDGGADARKLRVESVQGVLPLPLLPDWLGKRPPVAGDWVKTLDDEFNGTTLNTSLWSVYGDNYWDKQSHWSKDDVLMGHGTVTLRYEKRDGPNNDDPKQKSSRYAAGYLHTYGLWAQRYGYFEARMKLPTAPGLWPAFWMMPDRGPSAGPEQWKRQDTANGGMEFDIMEHLDRWGTHRYNIAMHYDGYGKDHKSLGSDRIYAAPDKDGYLTCGLLWTPGVAVCYCNGREVLRWEDPRISSVPEILMLTLPMGGWDNDPLDDARLPDGFVIDYVRVWQRRDLASPGDGQEHAPPTATR